jgi:hypothetical protein
MPGSGPGIHGTATGAAEWGKGVDGRVKPGHDDGVNRFLRLNTRMMRLERPILSPPPRKRGSRACPWLEQGATNRRLSWVPAFAGMTMAWGCAVL